MNAFWPALMGRVNQHLGIRPRDWPLLLLMLAHVFVALTLTISLRSLNSGLFLSAFPATVYPWYFLADSVLSFVLSLAYGNLASGRLTRRQESLGFLVLFALVMIGGRMLLFQQLKWVHFALPVICESLSALLMIQAWTLYADSIDSRKARRLFPLIGLGGTCGGIFGGWLASSLAHLLGTENLLFVEGLLLGLLGAGTVLLLKRSADPEQKMELKREAVESQEQSLWQRSREVVVSVLANKLLVRVLVILICVRVASTIMDYQLQLQLKASLTQNSITSFMGTYFAVTSLVTLVIQLTLENRIINQQGVVWGMGSTPLTLGLGLLGFLLSPSLMSATFAKFFEQITRNSLYKTAVELVYLPFDSALRRRLRVMVNGILSLTTVPLASVTIILFSQKLHILVFIALGFAAAGLLFSVLLQGPYTRKLHDSLMRRRLLTEDQVESLEQSALPAEAIEAQLTRGDIGMILFTLDLLKRRAVPMEPEKLRPLLFHANPFVRAGALHVLSRQADDGDLQLVLDILTHERDARVRQACFAVLRQLGDEAQIDLALPFLADSNRDVRAECLLFLFTKGGIEGILAGAEQLKEMTDSGNSAELAAAAYVIGEIGIRYFRSDFLELLRHSNSAVRQATLEAAAHNLPPELIAELLPFLADRSLARLARLALQQQPAELMLPQAKECFGSSTDIFVQLELVRLISSFRAAEAVDLLMELLGHVDIRIKYQVLQGLTQLRRHEAFDPEPYQERVYAQLRREFYFGYHYFYLLTLMRKNPGDPVRSRFLQSELKHKIRFVQEMIFRLLGLLHPTDEIYKAFLNFRSQSAHFRALSLEVLSYTLQGSLLELVLTFLDDLPYENKLAKAREYQLINDSGPQNWWESPVILVDPWLAQLASWCRQDAEPAKSPVSASDTPANETPPEDSQMFEMLDKMFLLKQTPVFAKFSAEQLFPVATAARDLFVPAQTLILRQGQPGDAFYIISSGTVAVERSGVRVTLLGEKECFGELEVLNADPSLAAVRTLSECEFLVISREDFIDLIEEYPDFSRGLLEVLSERLAAHVIKLSRTQPLGTGSLWAESTEDFKEIGIVNNEQ
ncbi:MAG: Npt1/Npt2 family nucleotide transporter [Candidatus Sericytochromatia bacterium]